MAVNEDFKIMPSVEAHGIPSHQDTEDIKNEVIIDETTALHRGLKSRHTAMIGMESPIIQFWMY
jgi:amino acid transporter